MFYLWPIDRCSNSRTALCWQSLDHIECFSLIHQFSTLLLLFRLGSHVIPTLKLIGVGGLLPRMIFHRLEPMFEYPEKWDFPIYIYTVSLFLGFFRVFWRFLPDFGFYRFFVHYPQENRCFLTFFGNRSHLFDIAIFWIRFFRSHSKRWDLVFIDFSFFGLFLLFLDRFTFFGSFDFLTFFYPFFIDPFFERFLSNVASVGRFLFCEKPEKVEKSRKNDVFWGPKKRVKVGPFCTTPIFGQKSCFLAS